MNRRIAAVFVALLALFALTNAPVAQAKQPARPPVVVTGSASSVGGTSSTLNGTVNPRQSATTAHFEWGLTTGYGSSTPDSAVNGRNRPVAVSAFLTGADGLIAATTYHYRLVATNADGTTLGADATLHHRHHLDYHHHVDVNHYVNTRPLPPPCRAAAAPVG